MSRWYVEFWDYSENSWRPKNKYVYVEAVDGKAAIEWVKRHYGDARRFKVMRDEEEEV